MNELDIKNWSDETLIRRLIELARLRPQHEEQEQRLFAEVYRRYANQLYSLSRYFGLNSADADEVVQETFYKLYDKIVHIQPDRPFKPYLFKMVHNLTKNKFRDVYRHPKEYLDDYLDLKADLFTDIHEITGNNDEIRGMVQKLPDKIRKTIVMKFFNGLEIREIAKAMGICVKSVYYRLDRGYNLLRNYYSK